VSLLVAAPGSAEEERVQRLDSTRAAKLHHLASEAFPSRGDRGREPRGEARATLDALDDLARQLARAEQRPSALRLRSVADRKRGAERALTELHGRLAERSTEEADALAERFAPIWNDVDAALAAPASRRKERLAAARARLEEARTRRGAAHSNSFVVAPLGVED
jgi:hypothetical protein